MRILDITRTRAIIEVDKKELDIIVNNYLEQQYMIGYEDGYNDWKKACGNANVDADWTEDDSQKDNS